VNPSIDDARSRRRKSGADAVEQAFAVGGENRDPRGAAVCIVFGNDAWRGIAGADNVLLFGRPGVGKSHLACALGHALVGAGISVLFTPTYQLVQQLLAARRDLTLPRALRALDAYDVMILDDLGYVQQTPDEAEVLFTLMAERYERRSLVITSNLVFSEWDRIFKNPMTTAAAIDRLVHHATILEIDRGSIRAEEARRRKDPKPTTITETTTTPRDDNYPTETHPA
jgi:DNA replication protein DnaC